MAKHVQFYRLNGAQSAQYLGLVGEVVVDLSGPGLRVHDGVTPGGYRMLTGTGNLVELTNQAVARQNLGLGTASVQDTDFFDLAGTAVAAINALALQKAGNLSELLDKSVSRTNLGVAIGADVQAYNAGLQSLSGAASAADKLPYFSAANTFSLTAFTALGRSLLAGVVPLDMRTTLGLGTASVQNIAAFLQPANNLADVASTAGARANLGLTNNATATVFVQNGGGPGGGIDGDWFFIY